jgi:nucleotide-binding universal stress UspA family protein
MNDQSGVKDLSINPLEIRQLLAGLENGPVDDVLLRYLRKFSDEVQVKSTAFVHVLPPTDFFSVNEYVESIQDDQHNEEKLVRDQLRNKIETEFSEAKTRYSIWVGEGKPLEVLLRNAEELNSDLVVIGQKTDSASHGITARNFARHVKCNALVIPDQAKFKLRKILVPVDFSENSGKALRTAIALAKALDKAPKIEVLHFFELPPNIGAYRFSETKLIQLIKEDREEAIPKFVDQYVAKEDQSLLRYTVAQSIRWPIGHHIAQYATEHGLDLIVNGAKGHSKLGLLLLGSVTEKLLANTNRIPVLIVK